MKKIVSFFLFLLATLTISPVFSASSITVKEAPKLEQAYDDSLSVYWEKQPGALGYYIYYSKTPSEWKTYESLVADFISGTGGTITWLTPETNYYVAIVAVDENGEESAYSPEAVFKTQAAGTSPKLAVKQVKIISSTSFKLIFNVGLDTRPEVTKDFKVVDQTNGWIEKEWNKSTIDPTDFRSIIIDMASPLGENTKYVVTVIAIQDKNGKTIESGIDGIISFVTPANFAVENIESQNVAVNTDTIPELNSWDVEAEAQNNMTATGAQNSWMKGQNIQLEEIKKTVTSSVAQDSKKLPQTGPEHIILLVISLMVWALVFIYTKRYQIKH